MPTVTRIFIKTGILYFLLAILLAFLAEIPALELQGLLLPVYWHMLMMGWIAQIIIGVAFWMFPRKYRDRPQREKWLTWLCYITLNLGLLLRFTTEPFLPLFTQSSGLAVMLVISAILQFLAVCFFIAEIWPRLQKKKKRR